MKSKLAHIAAYLILIAIGITSSYFLIKEREKNSRISNDFKIAYNNGFSTFQTYKAKNGQLVQRNRVLELSSQELRSGITEDILAQLANLGIIPAKVVQYTTNVIESEKHIKTIIRDSIRYDTVLIKKFSYQDKFYDVKGSIIRDSIDLKIHSSDSITQVVYKGHRYNRFGKQVPGILFWHPRRLEQVISCANPSNKIIYSKTISITK
jgi:hypothetical protein